ncbi:MAG TPA: hypothetical protein VEV15_14400, partial [Flavisolibacter sp.]|nr:hypothetical protein [Flavisolibacter sp.]
FVTMPSSHLTTLLLIGLINILSGISISGINLALGNIGMKLAPKDEAIVYLSARNMIVAFVSALGPLMGGWLADFFSARSFVWDIQWHGPNGVSVFHLLELHNWSFLFIIGGVLAIAALKTLKKVKEEGEVEKLVAVAEIRVDFKNRLKEKITRQSIVSLLLLPVTYPVALKKRVVTRIERRVVNLRKWNEAIAEKRRA